MKPPLHLALHTLSCRALGMDDAPALQALFERCRGYFAAADRRPPAKHAALERLADAFDDDHALLGFTDGGSEELCGFLELRLHEPDPDAATIVLLLLAPRMRRRGLGREIVEAAAEALRAREIRSMHLGVQAHEKEARAFWGALGFLPEGRTGRVTDYMRPL